MLLYLNTKLFTLFNCNVFAMKLKWIRANIDLVFKDLFQNIRESETANILSENEMLINREPG